MVTETITWRAVADELPDAESTVLCSATDAGVFEGFFDGIDDAGAQVWRDVTAMPVKDVTHWADMPNGPIEHEAITAAERAGFTTLRDGSTVDLGARWKLPT